MRLQDLRNHRTKMSITAYSVGKRLIQGWTLAQVRRALGLTETALRELRNEIRGVTGVLILPKEPSSKSDVRVLVADRCRVCGLLEPHACMEAAGRGRAEGWTW